MSNYTALRELNISNKNVLVRVDINVPTVNGRVTDLTRIHAVLPTINYIISKGGKPILMSHFGRPKGKYIRDLSLISIIPTIEKVFSRNVILLTNDSHVKMRNLGKNDIGLLENLRFNPGEEKNDGAFAKLLASYGDIYVNDAFSASHRSHSSIDAIAKLLPNCMGLSMEAELKALEALFKNPLLPLTAIIGGSKISSKLELIKNLISKVDNLIIGGGMANTFLASQNFEIGNSINEMSMYNVSKSILESAKTHDCKIHLPLDIVVSEGLNDANYEIFNVNECPKNKMILDVGPLTIKNIKSVLTNSRTLIWNGPLGAFEYQPYDKATKELSIMVASQTKAGNLISVAGGGDTISALNITDSANSLSYVSTAGGAFLEWLEGRSLPGVKALQNPLPL